MHRELTSPPHALLTALTVYCGGETHYYLIITYSQLVVVKNTEIHTQICMIKSARMNRTEILMVRVVRRLGLALAVASVGGGAGAAVRRMVHASPDASSDAARVVAVVHHVAAAGVAHVGKAFEGAVHRAEIGAAHVGRDC